MNKSILLVLLMVMALSLSANIIKDLKVEDIAYDDGTGLIVSWIPLPKEERIIEYRVYRGISPDSLFHIASIEVDPILGVTAPRMFYYDRSYSEFVSLYSPAKLRKEAQQPIDSPLYRKMPRDIDIYGQYLAHYTVLGDIAKNDFYFKSRKIESEDSVYAGLPLRSFEGLYSQLISGKEYYYAVVSVDQTRRYLPRSEIVSAIPIPNPPESGDKFDVLIMSDIRQINFEYSNPLFADDIAYRTVYIFEEKDKSLVESFIKGESEINPAYPIFKNPSDDGLSLPYIGSIESMDGKIAVIDSDDYLPIDWEQLSKYRFFLQYVDYTNYSAFTTIKEPRIKTLKDLPTLPEYTIEDKPDDKGDYIRVSVGKPLVYMNQGTLLSRDKTRIQLNYESVDNKMHRIRKLMFRFFDIEGNFISEIDEFFPDKILRLKLPSPQTIYDGLTVEIIPITNTITLDSGYKLTQKIIYNHEFDFIEFGDLFVNGENIGDFNFYIYSRSKMDASFSLTRNMSPFASIFEDNIPYDETIYKLVNQREGKLLLVDPNIQIGYDRKSETPISTIIFLDEIEKNLSQFKNQIIEYQALSAEEPDNLEYAYYLAYYETLLKMETENPILQQVNTIENSRKRLKEISRIRSENSRSYEYILAKTDGNALFRVDDVFTDEYDESYIFPRPDWFASDQLGALIASLIFGLLVFIMIQQAKQGKEMYIRPIAGLEEIDNAIGRATEMGKPVLFVPGIGYIEDIATLAALSILGHVARKTAEYDTRILVPCADYIVLPVAMETVKEAHVAAGRPDSYNQDDVSYIAGDQFAFVAGVNGIMSRQKTVANFFLGVFFAEALIMTETGNSLGAVQIAGSDSITQIPFFITTCDYTLIGEELYGASAYMGREPPMIGTLKAQDYTKFIILTIIVVGTLLSTARLTFFINAFPSQ